MDRLFADGALDAVVVAGNDRDVGGGFRAGTVTVSVTLLVVFGFDGADRARDRGIDGAVFKRLFHIGKLLLLSAQLVLLFADFQVLRGDVHLDIVFLVFAGFGELLLETFQFFSSGLDVIFKAQDIQLQLFV
ncbi:MAG: hypothetical protein II000_02465 [Clostridia bacterium]|nr:hypothetical protein [Clostridia bacterium]